MTVNVIREGSLRQLWSVSSSLLISFFSMVAMMFCDRLFLANYSASALNAAASAGTLFWSTNFMLITLCAMAEVFVAQFNGAKQYEKLGHPVWQMIWLSIGSVTLFYFLSFFGSEYLHKTGIFNQEEAYFYKWNHIFSPCFALLAALSAFFIGQGKTQLIKWMAILGNLVNIALDPLFIFGWKGWIPAMGIKGAAIATGLGVIIQVVVLSFYFLKKQNRLLFGTGDWQFNPSLFKQCLKVGIPPGLFVLFEIVGWAVFYKMMEAISLSHILVASVTQSILILLIFFGMAIEKATAAVSGNLIGARCFHEVGRLFRSGVLMCLAFGVIVAVLLIGFPDLFISLFFQNQDELIGKGLLTLQELTQVKAAIRFGLIILVIHLTIENIRFVASGILTSAGDTFFLMITGTCSIWFFLVLPTYLFILKTQGSIESAFYIWILYCVMTTGIMYIRLRTNKWRKKHLIESESTDQLETSSSASMNPAKNMLD